MDIQSLLAELARLRERVRELEERSSLPPGALERLAAVAHVGLLIVDRELRCLFVNDYLAALHGRGVRQCLGHTLREVVGAGADQLEPICRRVLKTGETETAQLRPPSPPGSRGEYVATCYALRDHEGAITAVCGTIRDVPSERTAEANLRDSERRYHELAESLIEFVWSEDANGNLESANPHGLAYAGAALADWREAVHPDDMRCLRTELANWTAELRIELRIRRASDGEYRWHLARIVRLPDDAGRARLIGTAIDIHDRKHEEQTRAVLASIVDSSSDSIIGLDLEGRIISWNPAAEKLFGYKTSNVIGRSAAILKPSRSETALRENLSRVARGETVELHETIHASADGRELQVFVSLAPIRDESGKVTGAFKTVRDVTEQRQAERELRAAHERFRMAQKALRAGIWEMDPATGQTHWSPEVYELAGIDPSMPPSFDLWLSRVHPDDAPRVRRNIMRARERGETIRHQFRVVRTGQIRWVTAFAQLISEPGRTARLIGITIDTTDLHAAEEAVRAAARFESIARLAGGVAHDFNNLLAGIMGGASFIAEVLPEDHSARPMLDLISRSSERAAQLTRQLLAYSGQGAFAPRRIDLSRAVQEACSLTRGSLPAEIQLEVQTSWNLPEVEADPNQIREVLLGLVSNASEAIGEGSGTVCVRTGIERFDRAAIASRFHNSDLPPGAYVYLEVQDTGPGMTPEVANRVFEPFFTTKFMGRGLGLSAIQGIVRGHHGAIELETKAGHGARFRLYFPAATTGRIADERPAGLRRGSVLVIDDEEAVRDVVHVALSRAGYTVITAPDGVAGLEIFRQREGQFSLVILDVSMPKMSGAEVLAELRRSGPLVKVMVTSGYPETEAMARIPQHEIVGFLQKPFTVRQLSAMIARALGETATAGD